MKIRYVDPIKSILALALGIIICWTATGNALEQGEAKATARVNLRRIPSLSGEILGIIPHGHNVTILQKKGLWCQVDVEGKINGQGWVYARYLERILPKSLETESFTQPVRDEIAAGEQNQGFHPIEPPPKSRTEVAAVKPSKRPLPSKTLITSVKGSSSARNELQDTQNEPIALSQLKIFMPVEPASMPAAQPPNSGFKQDAPEISGIDSSELIEQEDSATFEKRIPDAKNKHGGAAQETVSTVSEQPMSAPHAIKSSAIRSSVSHETKELTFKQRTIGPVAIALKLLSIVLYCFVALLLFKGY